MVNFTLTVTEQELMIISEGLGNLPFKTSAAIIQKLQKQITDQQQNASPKEE
jgi:hypothetical protein